MKYTKEEWLKKGEKLFGKDKMKWKFICPSCKHIQTPEDFKQFKDKGANPNTAYQDCIGRWTGGLNGLHKCDWASYGLFCGPDFVDETPVFAFAE